MNGIVLLLGATALFAVAYFFYGRLIERVLGVDPARPTPAKTRGDGVDYVPAHPAVLFGHHFASIAGAGPIVGPIAAAYFGWGAVMAWVVLGCIFIGAVHDMVSLYLSVRHEGRSIASVIETVLGRPGKLLFLLFCWSTLVLVCAEFTRQVALTFVNAPEVATASLLFIALAVVFGLAINRLRVPLLPATIVFVPVMFAFIWVGTKLPLDLVSAFGLSKAGAQTAWSVVLLVYCFLASTLPVWLLLQPRDYLNSYLLYAMMGLGFLGVFAAAPAVNLDAFVGWRATNAKGAPTPLFPFLFITIACGACSGFHALVASGTTAKQLDSERHIRPVAYGGMLLEGVLADVGPVDDLDHRDVVGDGVFEVALVVARDGHDGARAVAGEDEVADEELAAQRRWDRERKRRRAEDHAQRLLGDHGETEGQQQRENRVGSIEALKEPALDDDADQRDQYRRGDDGAAEADMRGEHDREIGADRIEGAMRQIDDAAEREDQRQAERDQEVIDPVEQPVQHLLDEEGEQGMAFANVCFDS